MSGRPLEEDRIDRIHFREPILPFDETIEGRAGSLRQVKKDDALSAWPLRGRDCRGWRRRFVCFDVLNERSSVLTIFSFGDQFLFVSFVAECSCLPPNLGDCAGCLTLKPSPCHSSQYSAVCVDDIEGRHLDRTHSFVPIEARPDFGIRDAPGRDIFARDRRSSSRCPPSVLSTGSFGC